MNTTLYQKISQRTYRRPQGPLTDDARQMARDLKAPAAERSIRIDGDRVTLHSETPISSETKPYRPEFAEFWRNYKSAAKPGMTVDSNSRPVQELTFGEARDSGAEDQAIPVRGVTFRSGLSLTAEAAGIRVAGKSSGFLAQAALAIVPEGLRISTEAVTQIIRGDGSSQVVTNQSRGKSGVELKAEVDPRGGYVVGDGQRTEDGRLDRESPTSAMKFGNEEVNPLLPYSDFAFVRPEDADRAVFRARSDARWALDEASRVPNNRSGRSLAYRSGDKAHNAEWNLERENLWVAEELAESSRELSRSSERASETNRRQNWEQTLQRRLKAERQSRDASSHRSSWSRTSRHW